MGYSDMYLRRMKSLGDNTYERNYRRKAHEYKIYSENTLNRFPCYIDGRKEYAIFQDHSQANNKDLSDDKYLILDNDVECNVGSYLQWDVPQWGKSEWLVFTEEHKTIPTHQQLKIKEVNQRLKWIVDYNGHKVCNNGEGWGAYVQNQTLYTLGVSFAGNYTSLVNAKMMLYLQDNEETRKLGIGTRLFIGSNIYKIEFADNISRVGLINFLLDEDTKNPEIDNYELGIADYWQKDDYKDKDKGGKDTTPTNPDTDDKPKDDENHDNTGDTPKEPNKPQIDWKIVGEDRAKLGRSYVYKTVYTDEQGVEQPYNVTEWVAADIEDLPFTIQDRTENTLAIRVKKDRRLVGQKSNIMAKDANGVVKNLAITIVNMF